MTFAILSGFLFAALTPLFTRFFNNFLSRIFSFLPVFLFIYFLSFLGKVSEPLFFGSEWIPSMGIDLIFRLDGLSLLFSLMITGIGSLVFWYTSYYLKGHEYLDRFYGYLSMFMASMLGLVLSDNLMTMFVFWELTSISSFFLIGFNNNDPASRKSAMTALSITGLGGLVLLAGIVWIASLGNTYSFTELLNHSELIKENPFYIWIIILVFIGAFTKSAQFPFHFWLPAAMKAPTPVSTYLHSATMVKAGIYLLARFTPLLGGQAEWNMTLTIVGAITMVYAAIHALYRVDLKSILAFSTISALGILVFLIGLGTEKALLAAGLFILAHALYKAALFLVAGIIDHETGTRDVSQISGLAKVMRPVAIAGGIAALSSAGFPFLFGFLSKEVMYEAVLGIGQFSAVLIVLLVLTKICLFVAGFWVGIKPFSGSESPASAKAKLPSALLYVPPLLLSILSLVFGIFPELIENALIQPVFSSMSGSSTVIHLKLWHGFNLVLGLSALTLIVGYGLYKVLTPSDHLLQKANRLEKASPESILSKFGTMSLRLASRWTGFFQNGYLRNYIITILGFLTLIMGYRLFSGVDIHIDWDQISPVTSSEIIVVVLMITSIIMAVLSKSRTLIIVALGVVGFANCLLFLFYSAPDLAMTQFSIDTLTVLLFMLVLFQLPPNKTFSSKRVRLRDAGLALIFGALISLLTLEIFEYPANMELSNYMAENAYTLAKGRNVVNVILVDYRSFDTLIETAVLVISAIGVASLMYLNLNSDNKPT